MNLVLFDDENRANLYPFTHTRPVADFRCGILTLRQRWEQLLSLSSSDLTVDSLSSLFPTRLTKENLYINGALIANHELVREIETLKPNRKLVDESGTLLAFKTEQELGTITELLSCSEQLSSKTTSVEIQIIRNLWDIFQMNPMLISFDFELMTHGRKSEPIPEHVTAIHPENIFIEPGARLGACILNATQGPIYLGRDSEIMDGAMIRGAFALCEKAVIKMGAKMYEGTTIGFYCKVGGEVSNTVFFNYSNKGHDGFIGNSVIGDWCNLGADTNCSNLKNNYDSVKIWNESKDSFVSTGLQFCGLMMGDHSKCGINTMFNTGTVVGVSCNIFGGGFPPKFIPSFTWGGHESSQDYRVEKAMETAERMMERRHQTLTEAHQQLFRNLFNQTKKQRTNQY